MLNRLRHRDPSLAALRRAGRAAIVAPAMIALGSEVIGNSTLATFAAFGSFAMLLLVDFAGPMGARLQAQAALAVTGAVFVVVGTLASQSPWLAAAAMTVVAFGVLYAGAVSSVLAGARTSLLLAFILPVALVAPVSAIPDRLAGWGLASGAALLAVAFLWPAPARDPVRDAAIAGCRALGARLRAQVAWSAGGGTPALEADREAAIAEAHDAVQKLHDVFFATPYRPTGLSTGARTVVRLVDELRWLDEIVLRDAPHPHRPMGDRNAAAKLAAATVLDRSADLLEAPTDLPDALHDATADLRARIHELADDAMLDDGISALDPAFRTRELGFVVTQIATNVDLSAAAERRSRLDQFLGRQPGELAGPLGAARERAGSYAQRHSVWLQNSIRGAIGLGVAVLIARLTGAQQAFWVVFGALSVLRTSALSTGENVVRAVLGTAVGFVAGAGLVVLIGTDETLLWVLLPPAVFLAGLAPAVVSFAAGQAAFTLLLLILFNILAPAGWEIGLVRIQDVVLGGAVSLAAGLLLWPRGAGAALGTALAEAYADSADYLASAVRFGISRCDAFEHRLPAPAEEATRAAAAGRRLDDTFRTYLAERGAKTVPLAEVTSLITGVVGLRLAGDAVLDLWRDDDPADGDRSAARRELDAGTERMSAWYHQLAAGLTGRGDVPDPQDDDERFAQRLLDTVGRDLSANDGHATATAVRVVWTGDHLDSARRLEAMVAAPARELVVR